MSEMKAGNIYTLDLVSQDEILAYVDKISMRDQEHVLLLSRLPQRRLIEHIDLDKVEAYWVTTQDVAGSIQPSLDQISDLITCLLYTSPSPRDPKTSRMPSSA